MMQAQSGVPLDSDTTDALLIPVLAQDPTVVPSEQPTSQDIYPYLTDDEFSSMIEKQESDFFSFLHKCFLRHHGKVDTTDIGIINHFPIDGNAHAQPSDGQPLPPLAFFPTGAESFEDLSSHGLADIERQCLQYEDSQAAIGPLSTPPRATYDPMSRPSIHSPPQSPLRPTATGHPSSVDLDIDSQNSFRFPLYGNERSYSDNVSCTPSSGSLAGSPTSSLPSPMGHLSSHLADINLQGLPLGRHGHSQASNGEVLSLVIPLNREVGPPTSSTNTTSPSVHSPAGNSAAGVHDTTEDGLRSVGSPQTRLAAFQRRTNDGIHECRYCNSTFTKSHNLRYHTYAHFGFKPYKCGACKFATSYPTTLRQHVKNSCKGMQQEVIP